MADAGTPAAHGAGDRWVVLREGPRLRWGGDLRRHYLFDGLIERTGATVVGDWQTRSTRRALRRWHGWPWQARRGPALVASTELLTDAHLDVIRRFGAGGVVDIHDDQVRQGEALGIPMPTSDRQALLARLAANLDVFPWLTAPSRPFAGLAGLPEDRVIVAGNGTDTEVVRPVPPPRGHAVGFISGAAPRRGIEELLDAIRIVRHSLPDTILILLLAATGDGSRRYLDALRQSVGALPWVEIGQAPYGELGAALGRANVLVIPTPGHAYWDSVPPLKLFDGMASARPHVVTPRVETARIVRERHVGLVASDDSAAAIAAALLRLLTDDALARELGANARIVAEREFDWRVLGVRLADELLQRSAASRGRAGLTGRGR